MSFSKTSFKLIELTRGEPSSVAFLFRVFIVHCEQVFILLAIINTKLVVDVHSELVLVDVGVLPVLLLVQVNICPELVLLKAIQPELVLLHGVLPELVVVHRVVPELVLVDIFLIGHVNSTHLVKFRIVFSKFTTLR